MMKMSGRLNASAGLWTPAATLVAMWASLFVVPPLGAQTAVESELRSRIENEGVESALEWYRDQAEVAGTRIQAGEGADALVAIAQDFAAEGPAADLLAIGHTGVEVHPDDVRLHRVHGDGHRVVDEPREAVQAYQQALQVDSSYAPVRSRLQELWGVPSPRPLGDVIAEAEAEGSFPRARDRFFALKRAFDQTGTYDFSSSGVLAEVRRLLEEGRMDDALLLAEVNRAVNRYTSESYLLAGEVGLLGPEPESTSFSFRGASDVIRILEERERDVQAWMVELHRRQPKPSADLLRVELDHARAHVRRGEKDLARDVYARILDADPTHREAREGLRLIGAVGGGG